MLAIVHPNAEADEGAVQHAPSEVQRGFINRAGNGTMAKHTCERMLAV